MPAGPAHTALSSLARTSRDTPKLRCSLSGTRFSVIVPSFVSGMPSQILVASKAL
jgi:hypothetical protein